MPRATTAACEVMPPRAVRIALASTIPWKSSGEVSRRTRMTDCPARPSFSARSASNTAVPHAAPGEAGRPVVSRSSWPDGSRVGWSSWLRSLGGIRATASSSEISPSSTISHAMRTAAWPGALAPPGLQHVHRAALDGELHVLHVAEVALQGPRHPLQLLVGGRQPLLERGDRLRRPRARHDVLALRVEQILPVERPLAGGRIPAERDAGPGVLPEVAEDHGHDVDRRAHRVGDVVQLPVVDRPARVPALEHRGDRAPQLAQRDRRETRGRSPSGCAP